MTLRTLQLVTSRKPFFEQQVDVLERYGVDCTVLAVPGETRDRSLIDYARFYGQVLWAVADGNFDLVHANYGLTAPAALLQPARPVVTSLWGSDLMGQFGGISERCARRSDAVVVMSDEMAERLDCDCAVVPHGIDTELFEPRPRRAALDEVGWSPKSHHVLFPYDPARTEKDFSRAERIAGRVDDDLDRQVELHAVTGVPHDRVPTYMNAADALLLTSEREGSPNAVKEALACNLPVVATPVGDVPNLLNGVKSSQVSGSDAALTEALADALTTADPPDGRQRARELGLDRMAERLLSVYDGVLSDRTIDSRIRDRPQVVA